MRLSASAGEAPRFRNESTNTKRSWNRKNLDIESITDARRAAIEQTIKPIGSDELKAIGEKLFPFLDHPWRQTFFQFLEENSGSTIYRATTNDAIEILYCAEKDITEKGASDPWSLGNARF
jgi:hypothetical protein